MAAEEIQAPARGAVPRTLAELETPCLLVDLDAAERNVAAMQSYCDRHGLAFRAHVKTHKNAFLARRQVEAGAVGLACQTVAEVEAMAAAGFDDLLLCLPALGPKAARLARLAGELTLAVALDSREAVEQLAAAVDPPAEIGVLVECDTGGRRAGVQEPEQALELARLVAARPGLRFRGLMTHPNPPEAAAWLARARDLIEAAGIAVETISVGSTATAREANGLGVATELRAGTYVFGDRSCLADGSVSLEDCALRVRSQVLSRPTGSRAILDAGSKSLSSDPVIGVDGAGFGRLDEYPEARLVALSEEHGHLQLPGDSEEPRIGEWVSILPNHACVAVNLHGQLVAHRGDTVVEVLRVMARRG